MPCIKLSSGKTVCYGNDNTPATYNHGGIVLQSNLGYSDPRHPQYAVGGETETPAFERTTATADINSGTKKKLDKVMPWEAPLKPGAWGGLDMRGMRNVTPDQQQAMDYATNAAQKAKVGKFYMDGQNYRLSNSDQLEKERIANSNTTMGAMYNMEKNVDQNSPVLQGIRQGGRDAAILLGGTIGGALAAPAIAGSLAGTATGLMNTPSIGNAANAAWKGYELYGATKHGIGALGSLAEGNTKEAGMHALEGVGYALGAKHAALPLMAGVNAITEGTKHYDETGDLGSSLTRGVLAGGANMLLGNAAHNLHVNHAVGDALSKYPTNFLSKEIAADSPGTKGALANTDYLETKVDTNSPYLKQLPTQGNFNTGGYIIADDGAKSQQAAINRAKAFEEGWLNSPMHKQMLAASVDKDNPVGVDSQYVDYITQKRKEGLNSWDAKFIPFNEDTRKQYYPNKTSYEYKNSLQGFNSAAPFGKTQVFGQTVPTLNVLPDLSKSPDLFLLNTPGTAYNNEGYWMSPQKGYGNTFIKNNLNKNLTLDVSAHEASHPTDWGGKFIPPSDIKLMSSLADVKTNPGTPALRNGVMQTYSQYVADPSETRARLQSLRTLAKDKGLYDPYKEKATMDVLQDFKKFKNSEYRQLRMIYSDDDILKLLNTVSMNDDKNNSQTV